MKKSIVVLSAIAALCVSPAAAAVVDGMVTRGAGAFAELDGSSSFTVGKNDFDTDALYAFNETQNFKLTEDLDLEIGSIKAGTLVSSHYVFFDPLAASRQSGWVDFDGEILGIATGFGSMAATDALISNDITYRNPNLRGLEGTDKVRIDNENSSRMLFNWRASSPGDYVRVFTLGVGDLNAQLSVVPVPASGLLLMGGLLGFAGLRRTTLS